MTTGIVNWPPVMYLVFAISLATMSKQTARKSENMISAITGIPVIAAPMAAPRIACSDIGVSRIRVGPNSSRRPTVVLKTPPAPAMSSPSITRVGIAAHLLGNAPGHRFAIAQFRHDDPPSAQTSVIRTCSVGRSPALAKAVASSTRSATWWTMSESRASGTPRRSRRW